MKYSKKYKIIISIIIIILMIILGVNLYIYMTSSHGTKYSSITSYTSKNGNCFYDFYNPKSYFDNKIKKETLSKINNIDIYYQGDPKNYYSINTKVIDNVNVVLIVNRNNEEIDLTNYKKEIINGITLYSSYYSDNNLLETMYTSKNINVSVQYEYEDGYQPKDSKEQEKLKSISQEIIIDSIELNEKEQ